jgi:hypothetical protein
MTILPSKKPYLTLLGMTLHGMLNHKSLMKLFHESILTIKTLLSLSSVYLQGGLIFLPNLRNQQKLLIGKTPHVPKKPWRLWTLGILNGFISTLKCPNVNHNNLQN